MKTLDQIGKKAPDLSKMTPARREEQGIKDVHADFKKMAKFRKGIAK